MKSYANAEIGPSHGGILPILGYLGHLRKLETMGSNTPNRELQNSNLIQIPQLNILQQMELYSSVKVIWGSGFTCSYLLEALGQIDKN